MLNRRRFVGLAAAAIAAPSIGPSRAAGADWPAKAVRVVVPFTPGGSTDTTARLVGNRLQEIWGQSVVIENKGGAGGNIAADMVAHSDADGYTIFISGPGMATNKFLYPSLSYDPVGDFDPVTMLITQPNLMCVPNSSPAKSVKEFIAFCQENKGKVTFASSGHGTSVHLSGELFKRLAKVEMLHVALSRRGSGAERPAARARRRHVQQYRRGAAADPGRQAARPWRDHGQTHACGAGLGAARGIGRARI